jgi:SAM-dependent methyltransferase
MLIPNGPLLRPAPVVGPEIRWRSPGAALIVPDMVDAEIIAYYSRGGEQDRLTSGRQRVEFLRIRDLLRRFLPPAPAKVLDVGGGAGVYALPLAAAGYEVHLIDPVPLHVEQAGAASRAAGRPLASVAVGDARDLAGAGTGFDAVLLLGPLYHLTSRAGRLAALREARRVARPGGVVVAKALSRFYPVLEEIAGGLPADPGRAERTARFLADGQFRNPGGDPANFTTAYFHRPEELADEVTEAGLDLRELVAPSGGVKLLPGLSELLDVPGQRDHVLSVLRLLEAEPSLLGMSQNFLAIARVPADG